MNAVNQLVSEASVLMLWEPREFSCQPICRADTWIDRWYLLRRSGLTQEKILEEWCSEGVTHVLLHRAGMDFVRQYDTRYDPGDWKGLEEILDRLVPLSRFGKGYDLYKITP
jgi:hypothetical protein